jgi:hypothetical protein
MSRPEKRNHESSNTCRKGIAGFAEGGISFTQEKKMVDLEVQRDS